MENNITLRNVKSDIAMSSKNINGATTTSVDVPHILQNIKTKAVAPIEWLRQYYSSVLGKEVTMSKTMRYLHAQCAFIMAVVPSYESLLTHIGMAVWFAIAVARCKQ